MWLFRRTRPAHTFRLNPADAVADDVATPFIVEPARPAAAVARFAVAVGRPATVGTPVRVAVAAVDAVGRVIADYTGTVRLVCSDAGATAPAEVRFAPADGGVRAVAVTFAAAGRRTVTATDGTAFGAAARTVAPTRPAVRLAVLPARPRAVTGVPQQLAVVALDAAERVVGDYAGAVRLVCSDEAALLPPAAVFAPADRGVKLVTVTFRTPGPQTVTATDAGGPPLSATVAVRVTAGR